MRSSKNRYKIKIFCALLVMGIISFFNLLAAQSPHVVKKSRIYWRQVQEDSSLFMTELRSLIPAIVYDLKYATSSNFTGEKLYGQGTVTFLRRPVAEALKKVEADLAAKGYGLKIFDAYRPYSVTKKMWDLIHDERYVANPAKGSGHNRGLSVDLTIIERSSGKELDMGTTFDHFSDTAHHSFNQLSPEILRNRLLLKQTMEHRGFRALETEWWHYSWPANRTYDVLDLEFNKLLKKNK
jgi:D-alanyl-D-alanine dipeptidase